MIETVCIAGSGFMGAQIGLQCAIHGYTVWLLDVSEDILRQVLCRVAVAHHGGAQAHDLVGVGAHQPLGGAAQVALGELRAERLVVHGGHRRS